MCDCLSFSSSNLTNSDDEDDRAFLKLLERELGINIPTGNGQEDEVECEVPVVENDEGESSTLHWFEDS